MKIGEVELGLLDYINKELAPKATGIQKFLMYTGASLGAGKLEQMFHQYKDHPVMKALDVVSDTEDIDIDKLYTAMKQAIKQVGKVEFMGILFDEKDIDTIYKYLKK